MANDPTSYRNYADHQTDRVANFYKQNHEGQTLAFARARQAQYKTLNQSTMSTWDAILKLDTLVDESDPDTDLSQLDHLLQTAEAIRLDNQPKWLQLTGLIHDLGKLLCFYGEPQWAVVGDTFPLGCKFSEHIIYSEFFERNGDYQQREYQTELGIYSRNCGLDQVTMSWGHDEYLYYVMAPYLPIEALYVIRYHSFYSAHQKGAYDYLMNETDREMFRWVKRFQPYDLYSKSDLPPDKTQLIQYYQSLIDEFLPPKLAW